MVYYESDHGKFDCEQHGGRVMFSDVSEVLPLIPGHAVDWGNQA
jgi:hypothetical protein